MYFKILHEIWTAYTEMIDDCWLLSVEGYICMKHVINTLCSNS